ncbi:MAG: c-type cytochrome [Gammaproteobacteria bacterium]
MKQNMIRSLVIVLALGSGAASAQDGEDGLSYEEKLAACAACHGENGDKPLAPDYPILAGQFADYTRWALEAYRSGRRDHPIMKMQVEALGLTSEDIARLAEHFAAKPGLESLAE